MTFLDWTRHFAIFFGTLGQLAFVVLWATRNPFSHFVPRSQFLKSFLFLVFLLLVCSRYVISYASENPPWTKDPGGVRVWDYIESTLYWAIALCCWYQLTSMVRQILSEKSFNDKL